MSIESKNLRDHSGISFWLETAGDLTPRSALSSSLDVDVAILGAGYTGLWTAYYLLRRDPSLRVVVLEREIAGFGASGRNGAWCSPNLSVTHKELLRRCGRSPAQKTVRAVRAAVDEVGRVAEEEGIGAQFRKGGLIRIARGAHELPALEAIRDGLESLGLAEGVQTLSAAELAERVRVNRAVAALFDPHCATIHPGRLVRGLARAVERRGGEIYEHTEVLEFEPGPRPRLRTASGGVRAEVVVLAGEAYLSQLQRFRRRVLPLYSLIVLTEPLAEEQWEAVGWGGEECLSSCRLTVDYLSRTVDGRILFGGRGAPYRFASRISDEYDRDEKTHAMLRESLIDWFPSLRGLRFTHAWGGPIGVKRDWIPTIDFDARRGTAAAYGYAGQGVAVSNLAGKALADLITGEQSDLSELPMIERHSLLWEPEPLRWLGVRYVQWALARLDAKGERTGRPPTGRSLAERLARH
jgi:glycine/D-amino acid oxidase-like deaminating enzyme